MHTYGHKWLDKGSDYLLFQALNVLFLPSCQEVVEFLFSQALIVYLSFPSGIRFVIPQIGLCIRRWGMRSCIAVEEEVQALYND